MGQPTVRGLWFEPADQFRFAGVAGFLESQKPEHWCKPHQRVGGFRNDAAGCGTDFALISHVSTHLLLLYSRHTGAHAAATRSARPHPPTLYPLAQAEQEFEEWPMGDEELASVC